MDMDSSVRLGDARGRRTAEGSRHCSGEAGRSGSLLPRE
ncbi:hypothetical protein SNL152K_1993 [Streptomyces sp. NL15-2K]|nr:hypothetical protein SNL152K_1993 [Streptomyces sp. NL15-2K]